MKAPKAAKMSVQHLSELNLTMTTHSMPITVNKSRLFIPLI